MARFRYTVSGDLWQAMAWKFAATAEGLTVAKFLAKAGSVYARHLAWKKTQREDRAGRKMERSLYEARRRR